MKIKTSQLSGPALDWAVAKVTGEQWSHHSTEWHLTGPLIDKYDVAINGGMFDNQRVTYATVREVKKDQPYACGRGITRLEAICRAIVASELGDEVEVPDELGGVG